MRKNLKRKKKNILFTEAGGIFGYRGFTQQFLSEAQQVKKKNYNIKIVAFEYPKEFTRKKNSRTLIRSLKSAGISYIIVPLLYDGNYTLKNIAVLVNTFILCLIALFHKAHIIHSHDRISAYYATLLKNFLNFHLIYDMHGVSVEEAIYAKRVKKNSYLHKKLNQKENHIVKRADKVFCVTAKMRDYVCSKYDTDISKFLITPTSVDTSLFSYSKEMKESSKSNLGLSNKLVVLYMGHANSWQLTEALVTLFKIVMEKRADAHFLILTDKKEIYEKEFNKHFIDRKFFSIYWVEHKMVPAYAKAADIAVLLRDDSILNRVAAPVKFGEYLSLGIPVMVTRGIGDTQDIIEEHNVGAVIKDLSIEALETSVDVLLNLIKKNQFKLSERCHAVAKSLLSNDVCINKFISVYDQL